MKTRKLTKTASSILAIDESEFKSICLIGEESKSILTVSGNRVGCEDLISVSFNKTCFFEKELSFYLNCPPEAIHSSDTHSKSMFDPRNRGTYDISLMKKSSLLSSSGCLFLFGNSDIFTNKGMLINGVFSNLLKVYGNKLMCSFLYIYKESCYDLFAKKKKRGNLKKKSFRSDLQKLSSFTRLQKIYVDKTNFKKRIRQSYMKIKQRYGIINTSSTKKKKDFERSFVMNMKKKKNVKTDYVSFDNKDEGTKVITLYFGENMSKRLHFIKFFDCTELVGSVDYKRVDRYDNSFNILNSISSDDLKVSSEENKMQLNNAKTISQFINIIKQLQRKDLEMKEMMMDESIDLNLTNSFLRVSKRKLSVPFRDTRLTNFLKTDMLNSKFIFAFNNRTKYHNVALLKLSKRFLKADKKFNYISKLRDEIMQLKEKNIHLVIDNNTIRSERNERMDEVKKLIASLNIKNQEINELKKKNNEIELQRLEVENQCDNLKREKFENYIQMQKEYKGISAEEVKRLLLVIKRNSEELAKTKKSAMTSTQNLGIVLRSMPKVGSELKGNALRKDGKENVQVSQAEIDQIGIIEKELGKQ